MAGVFTVCQKEVADHFGSKRFLILFALIVLISTMSAYQGSDYIRNNPEAGFLAVYTGARFGFSFIQIMVFFGPILGLALGFDSINKERTSGSLSILLSQPIFRDSVINGKFLAGAIALTTLTVGTLGVMSTVAISIIGFGPTLGEASNVIILILLTVLYLVFWLSLGLLFSVLTKKTSTSILASIAVWLFCSMIISILAVSVANMMVPLPVEIRGGRFNPGQSSEYRELFERRFAVQSNILKLSPTNLYSETASSILGTTQSFMGMGPTGPNPTRTLTLTQSVMAGWPNILTIIVGLVVCFVASYMRFLRLEIRPGG